MYIFMNNIVAFIIKKIIEIKLKRFKYILKNFQELGGNHSEHMCTTYFGIVEDYSKTWLHLCD